MKEELKAFDSQVLLDELRERFAQGEFHSILIAWSIEDLEQEAMYMEKESCDTETKKTYDRSLFRDALSLIERRHDAEIGVTWKTLRNVLDEICLVKTPEVNLDKYAMIAFSKGVSSMRMALDKLVEHIIANYPENA